MGLLHSYQNGNTQVAIYDDGTKIREYSASELPNPVFPESMDVKITNYCDLHNFCTWCHESSDTRGKHGDLNLLMSKLNTLPAGTELAIGGGNPLSHPDLLHFLQKCKESNWIPNLTVNGLHVKRYKDFLLTLGVNKLIYGLGISYSPKTDLSAVKELSTCVQIVYHVIAGINSLQDLDTIIEYHAANGLDKPRILLLGAKSYGRGKEYCEDNGVQQKLNTWYYKLHTYFSSLHLSFDNLGVKQMNIRRFFKDENWEKYYMGNDGQYTMYVDAVEEKFAVSSTSVERTDMNGYTHIGDMFAVIKN